MLSKDSPGAITQDFGSLHILHFHDGEHLASNQPGHLHPGSQANGNEDLPVALTKDKTQGNNHQEGRNTPKNLNDTRQHAVSPSTIVPRYGTKWNANEKSDGNRNESDTQ